MLPGLSAFITTSMAEAGGFTAEVAPDKVTKTGSTTGAPKTLSTTNVTVTPTGGAGGYTYAWVRTFGSALITATSAAAANTVFAATLNADDRLTATFTCTVTDAHGATASADVDVSITLVSL
jgi:hypothetical protein